MTEIAATSATPANPDAPSPAHAPSSARRSAAGLTLAFALLCAGCAGAAPADDDAASAQAARAAARAAAVAERLAMSRPIAAHATPWIEEMTWLEVRDAIAGGKKTVIVPTGGIEGNGPFLAMGKHDYILQATCPVLAEQLGDALCAPIVPFVPEGDIDPPTGSMHFPGTISLTAETYEALLVDIGASLGQAGFRDVVFIGDSGGNQRGMAAAADALNARWSERDVRAHFVRAFYDPGWVATENHTAEVLGVSEGEHDGHHDDIWVTAMMMVVDPTHVRHAERVEAGLASINGVDIADAEETAALGRAMVEFRAALTADAIRAAIADRAD